MNDPLSFPEWVASGLRHRRPKSRLGVNVVIRRKNVEPIPYRLVMAEGAASDDPPMGHDVGGHFSRRLSTHGQTNEFV